MIVNIRIRREKVCELIDVKRLGRRLALGFLRLLQRRRHLRIQHLPIILSLFTFLILLQRYRQSMFRLGHASSRHVDYSLLRLLQRLQLYRLEFLRRRLRSPRHPRRVPPTVASFVAPGAIRRRGGVFIRGDDGNGCARVVWCWTKEFFIRRRAVDPRPAGLAVRAVGRALKRRAPTRAHRLALHRRSPSALSEAWTRARVCAIHSTAIVR